MGIILYIVATILWLPLTILNWIYVAKNNGLSNQYFKQTAVDIDRFGNHNFRTLLNETLILKSGYKFGNVNETISSVLGKNERDNTLTELGLKICNILNSIDPNHCFKSIKEL